MKKTTIKKLLAVVSVAFLGSLILTGCGKSSSDQSLKQIQDKKELVLGTSADYPPFEFTTMKDGKKQIVGYDILIAQQIAKDMGVKLKVVNTAFPSLISELQDKKVDIVMAGMVSTDQRKKAVDFTKSYYKNSNVLLVKKGEAAKYNTVASLKGKAVGAQQSTTQEKIGKKQLAAANLVTEANFTNLTNEVKTGTLSGVIAEKVVADNVIKSNPGQYEIAQVKLKTPASDAPVSIAVRKNSPALKKQLNKSITKLQKNGDLDKFMQKAQDLQLEQK